MKPGRRELIIGTALAPLAALARTRMATPVAAAAADGDDLWERTRQRFDLSAEGIRARLGAARGVRVPPGHRSGRVEARTHELALRLKVGLGGIVCFSLAGGERRTWYAGFAIGASSPR